MLKRFGSGWALLSKTEFRPALDHSDNSFPGVASWLVDRERPGWFDAERHRSWLALARSFVEALGEPAGPREYWQHEERIGHRQTPVMRGYSGQGVVRGGAGRMRGWSSTGHLAALMLLAGCERREAEGQEASAPAPLAATVTPAGPDHASLLPAALSAPSDADALTAAADAYAAAEKPLTLMPDEEGGGRHFDVIDCDEEFRGTDPTHRSPPDEQVARRVALLQRSLRLAGYRDAVFSGPLSDYRQRVLASAPAAAAGTQGKALDRLARDIDARRTALQPQQPPVRAEGGCGAAEIPIVVRSEPAGGRVWMITRFAFELCRAKRLDPWNRDACDRWSEMDPKRPAELSGNYLYQAAWPGGGTTRGTRRIDPDPTGDDDRPQAIVVARP